MLVIFYLKVTFHFNPTFQTFDSQTVPNGLVNRIQFVPMIQ